MGGYNPQKAWYCDRHVDGRVSWRGEDRDCWVCGEPGYPGHQAVTSCAAMWTTQKADAAEVAS